MDPKSVQRVIAVLERHRAALLALPGVVGADVVPAADGQPAIVAYVESPELVAAYGGVKIALESGSRVRFRGPA